MKLLFVADPLDTFKTYKDSTFAMMREAARRGHALIACEPQQLVWQRGGRVTASDVEAHAAGAQTLAPQQDLVPAEATEEAPLATRVSVPQEGVIERVPFRGIRRKIAEALHHSVQTAVHFTVVDEADVTALQKRQKGLEEFIGRKLSLLPFVMTAVCKTLEKHPSLNATVDDFVDEEGALPGRPQDLVGLVSFAGFVQTDCPLTMDHVAFLGLLEGVEMPRVDPRDPAQSELLATAIGDALVVAVDRLSDVSVESKVIVLLTDGRNNVGTCFCLSDSHTSKKR